MRDLNRLNLGIYEKALPKDIDWIERIHLVKECGLMKKSTEYMLSL